MKKKKKKKKKKMKKMKKRETNGIDGRGETVSVKISQ